MTAMDAPTSTDQDIVAEVLSGRTDRFAPLVRRYLPTVVGFLRYLGATPSESDDVAQEAFLKAFQHLGSYDRQRSFPTWLLAIAKNTFLNERRRQGREGTFVKRLAEEPSPFRQIEETAMNRCLATDILEALSEEDRFLIQLRIYQDLPFAEIAAILEESENTVRVRFHRLLSRLQGAHGAREKEHVT